MYNPYLTRSKFESGPQQFSQITMGFPSNHRNQQQFSQFNSNYSTQSHNNQGGQGRGGLFHPPEHISQDDNNHIYKPIGQNFSRTNLQYNDSNNDLNANSLLRSLYSRSLQASANNSNIHFQSSNDQYIPPQDYRLFRDLVMNAPNPSQSRSMKQQLSQILSSNSAISDVSTAPTLKNKTFNTNFDKSEAEQIQEIKEKLKNVMGFIKILNVQLSDQEEAKIKLEKQLIELEFTEKKKILKEKGKDASEEVKKPESKRQILNNKERNFLETQLNADWEANPKKPWDKPYILQLMKQTPLGGSLDWRKIFKWQYDYRKKNSKQIEKEKVSAASRTIKKGKQGEKDIRRKKSTLGCHGKKKGK